MLSARSLEIFTAVYRTGSVSDAARQLQLTQPAVSHAIAQLESDYGVCLFERIRHRLRPTEAADRLYPQVCHLLQETEALEESLSGAERQRVLRLGFTSAPAAALLPRFYRDFQATCPDQPLRLRVDSGVSLFSALTEGRVDFAVIEGYAAQPHMSSRLLYTDANVLVLPPGHPLAHKKKIRLSDLRGEPLLLREGISGQDVISRELKRLGFSPQPLLESTSVSALLSCVRQGLGLSFLPQSLVQEDAARGTLVVRTPEDASFQREAHLVWQEGKRISPAMEKLMSVLTAQADSLDE